MLDHYAVEAADTVFRAGATTRIGHGEGIVSGSTAGKRYSSCSLTTLK